MNTNIRWQQRLDNFLKASTQLDAAIHLAKARPLSDLEKQGAIQTFKFTHELAWNLMNDYFNYQGQSNITGSRDAIREAFNKGLIADGEGWMETIASRNKTSHTYNQAIADEIVNHIITHYGVLFRDFAKKMITIRDTNPL